MKCILKLLFQIDKADSWYRYGTPVRVDKMPGNLILEKKTLEPGRILITSTAPAFSLAFPFLLLGGPDGCSCGASTIP